MDKDDESTSVRKWLDEFTANSGEPVEVILIDGALWQYDQYDQEPSTVDRVFDAGYGRTYCPPFCAWSASWVVFPAQYDGSEWWERVPRNPIVHRPVQPGGS